MSEEANSKEKRTTSPPFRRLKVGTYFIDSVDEAPEFHNPYSELNLFLSQKIKHEMRHCSNSKKWSIKLQDELLHKIGPEFEQRFPRYRLGLAALKKTWEKVSYYSAQLQRQEEALTCDGKLNIPFLIKENLRHFSKTKNICQLHPYHYAHQLALKMSECIAIVDGTYPKVDQLTQAIWSIHRHLIPQIHLEDLKTPHGEHDKIDKLIVRKILETTAKQLRISEMDLRFCLQQFFKRAIHLLNTFSIQEIRQLVLAILSEKNGMASQEPLLDKLTFPLCELFEVEIARVLIDSPRKSFSEIAQLVGETFEQIRLLKIDQLEKNTLESKIQIWTQQSDLLCRWIRLQLESSLIDLVKKNWKRENFEATVIQTTQEYVAEHPILLPYTKFIVERIWTLVKYLWYAQYPNSESSTFDRFLTWHAHLLNEQSPELSPEETITSLKLLCQRTLPLVPFDMDRAFAAIYQKDSK